MLIVANKADILNYTGDGDVLEMSTETGQGVDDVLEKLVGILEKLKMSSDTEKSRSH
jgi:predicted GTPase